MHARYDKPTEAEAFAILTLLDYLHDDLLTPKQLAKVRRTPTAGHCYVMAEALVYLFGWLDQDRYRPARVKVGNDTHWFVMVQDEPRLRVLDPTADQFRERVRYEQASRTWFTNGKEPSRRCLDLLDRASLL